ncbi:MAG: hypothetical protein HXX19_19290 [Rhodoferax sp.]|nr:hypothetical protein [Rhodoferax sp.]
MKILIASPSYDGAVRKEYMQSVMALTDYFRQAGIAWELMLEPATLLHVMRSVMASKVLIDESFTHLLFVDTDMGFAVSAVQKLIDAKKDVIGCAYPYRTIPLHESIKKDSQTLRQAISEAVPYSIKFPPGTQTLDVKNGLCEVISIGTGLLLISRETLQTLKDAPSVGRFRTGFPYTQWYSGSHYHGFFDHVLVDEAYMSEDYSFCHRWVNECRGKIFAVVDHEIMHVGPVPVLGRYVDRLKSGKL